MTLYNTNIYSILIINIYFYKIVFVLADNKEEMTFPIGILKGFNSECFSREIRQRLCGQVSLKVSLRLMTRNTLK